ncbi:nucleoside triphosphate hydrolase [Xinfangfangia pollutisoli]|uniref:nucleoside triphosphate hydrolase n=1 Tax=Xinfangfangia pollutisoli TaxID=2865960 RepID=UPI001CD1D067|nr:nucleoside triphosphate hydrolase [Xinfangfangia pollutisoli]
MTPEDLARLIADRAAARQGAAAETRFLVALAGPPAGGKSTLAADLAQRLSPGARVVPMDGFHYDDAVLNGRGLRQRKGAPDTFDSAGFLHLVRRLRHEAEVAIPLFDRDRELSRAGADIVTPEDHILIVEGNYLLLDAQPWRQLRPLFDLTLFFDLPEATLVERLRNRWRQHGKTEAEAEAWIAGNDLPNIRLVQSRSGPAEIVLTGPAA